MSLTGSVLEEQFSKWDLVLLLSGGTEYVLDQWTTLSVSISLDGAVTASIEVNGLEPSLGYVRELVTDVLIYRNAVLLFRLRVVDTDDTFSRDAWTVALELVSYEHLLARRMLFADWVLVDLDIDAAWKLIEYTQNRETLGITRGTLEQGVQRQRSLGMGDSIREAINDFAEAEAGYDWWIDQNLVWWVQKPRRGRTHDAEWRWGAEVAEVSRTSPVEDYANVVMAVGAQNETKIPDPPNPDRVYPPPTPQIAQTTDWPFGLWESAVSYSNVITEASLLEKANWHLGQMANIRPTYKLLLEPGIWTPNHQVGDVVPLRIQAPPRLDVRVPVRVEEIQISLTADGQETVSMSGRAEEPETFVTPSPIGPYPILPVAPTGKTRPAHRLRPEDDIAALLRNFDARLGRQERHQGA
jgi:hypothetical protein